MTFQLPSAPRTFLNVREREAWRVARERPDFMELFHKFTMERIERGFKRYGAHHVIGQIRWYTDVPNENNWIKISNNHFPYFARIWMRANPAYPGFFKTQQIPDEKIINTDVDDYDPSL